MKRTNNRLSDDEIFDAEIARIREVALRYKERMDKEEDKQ